jgi:hypothetical protein
MNFESVHNYYEHLVYEEIVVNRARHHLPEDPNMLEDVACVALNKLPAKYIRHDIDLAFYLTSAEREKQEKAIRQAVSEAAEYVMARTRARARAN